MSRTWLKNARRSAGLSREKLAVKLGMSASSVNSWEAGKATPSAPVQEKIGQLLGVDAVSLFVSDRAHRVVA